jgi:hypothetical protein
MRYVHSQAGAALIILLTIFILGSITFLLSQLNERAHYMLDDQEQTIRVLTQAKEALLGFAATYAQNHEVKLQGYLPCPNRDGDGSAEPPCSEKGQTVIGRFPWRTLGIPPLRDGSGECLWYAVSGNFKDNPKQWLTSDSNGMIVIRNAKNEIITGSDQAIAVIFAPGRITKDQTRGIATNPLTECGSKIVGPIIEPINQVRNYLDKYNFDGVVLDNATANNAIFISPTSGFFASSLLIPGVTPQFINAPPVYETYLHPYDDTERLDRANPTFNDTLITITPEDFKPIYRMMDYQVATQVRACLDRYAQQSLYQFMDTTTRLINQLITDGYLLPENYNQILTTIKNDVKNKNVYFPKYSWPSQLGNPYFGRIPNKPILTSSNITNSLFQTKKYLGGVFSLYQNPNSSVDLPGELDNWEPKFFNIPTNWPVDPQTPFLILDLQPLEYEALKSNSQIGISEIRNRVLATLQESEVVIAFATSYNISLTDLPEIVKAKVIAKINSISDKTTLIADIVKIHSILQDPTKPVSPAIQRYQCFNSSSELNSWGWWSGWQDKVFFAIHSNYSLNNTVNSDLTFTTPKEKDNVIRAEMLVLVAGRQLNGQQRSTPTQQNDITNYLEGQNSDGDTRFVHAPVTPTFNDVVL